MTMKVQKRLVSLLTGAASVLSLTGPTLAGQTGNFNGPLTTNLLASVDLNGGLSSDAKPTQGYNGSTTTPLFGQDQYGVTWSPWGGGNSTFGDGTVWPQSSGGPQAGTTSTAASAPAGLTNNVNYFSKTFGTVTVAVSAPGTITNYAVTPIDSRDRQSSGPSYTYSAATNNTAALDGDMFRDLIFAGVNNNVQGTNYLQVQFSGLTAGQQYQVVLYSYDNAAARTTNWTATAPTNGGYSNASGFAAPADEQTITWTANAATPPAGAVFTLTANSNGTASVFGFGGSGTTGDSSASSTYLNGFQIAAVPAATPEPSGMLSLLGGAFALGGLALKARRRRSLA